MAKMLIIGASRGVGLETVRRALAEKHQVRALARSADTIPINDANLEKTSGDARNAATLLSALAGIDAVIQTLGVSINPEVIVRGTTLFSTSTRALVDAMGGSGVKRLIVVTGFGAGDSRGHGGFLYDAVLFPLLMKRIYDDKDVQEQIVRRSGLDWTIVRPGLLTSGPRSEAYRVLETRREWRAGSISRADVADFLVRQVSDKSYLGKTPLLV